MKKTPVSLGVIALAVLAAPASHATLAIYDAAIATSGFAARTTSVSSAFTGTNQVAFDFGAISGDATFEFILSGDPVGGGQDGFLAHADADGSNSLRYEQWNDTGQLGFTRSGAADYIFAPAVLSPTADTHIAYRWTDATDTMDLFLDGTLAGTATGVSVAFQMPTGPGRLGNNAGNSEGMVGTISRVTTFNSALNPADIASHANAWLVPEPSGMALIGLAGLAIIIRRRR
ncbi:MAG: hypothetical protein ACI9UA_005949 [Pseudoalteromonas tetraodonis]|jgi:hypothetical protein